MQDIWLQILHLSITGSWLLEVDAINSKASFTNLHLRAAYNFECCQIQYLWLQIAKTINFAIEKISPKCEIRVLRLIIKVYSTFSFTT